MSGVIKARDLATDPASGAPPAASHDACATPPRIELHRRDGVVEAIEVTCPCGNTMVIACRYDDTRNA